MIGTNICNELDFRRRRYRKDVVRHRKEHEERRIDEACQAPNFTCDGETSENKNRCSHKSEQGMNQGYLPNAGESDLVHGVVRNGPRMPPNSAFTSRLANVDK